MISDIYMGILTEKFTERLYQASEKSGKNQRDISRKLKVTPETVNTWFKGRNAPRFDRIEELANFLGVTPLWLVGANESPQMVISDAYNAIKALELLGPKLMSEMANTNTAHIELLKETLEDFYISQKDVDIEREDKEEKA